MRRFAKNFSSKRDLCELLLSNAQQYTVHTTHAHTHKGKTVKYARLLNARRVFTPATNDRNNQIKWTKTPMAYSTFNKSGEQNRANGMKTSPKHAQTFAADAAFLPPFRICALWVCHFLLNTIFIRYFYLYPFTCFLACFIAKIWKKWHCLRLNELYTTNKEEEQRNDDHDGFVQCTWCFKRGLTLANVRLECLH